MPPRKAQSKSKAKPPKKMEIEDEVESEEEETPVKRSTRSTSAKAPVKKKVEKKPAAKSNIRVKASSKIKPAAKGKRKEESEDEEEEEEPKTKSKKNGKAATTKKPAAKSKIRVKASSKIKPKGKKVEEEEEDEEEEEQADQEEEEQEKKEEDGDGEEMEEEKKETKKGKGAKKEAKTTNGKRGRAKSQEKELDEDAEDSEKPSKQVKLDLNAIEVPVDEGVPNRRNYKVYIKNEEKIYDAKLNQTNTKHNNNKFYCIQILQSLSNTSANNFYVINRWGRVGMFGDTKFSGPMGEAKAISEYEKKLKDKSVKGDYRILEMDYTKEVPQQETDMKLADSLKSTKLKKPIAEFVNLIFDTKLAAKQMENAGFDVKKQPLGKLSKNTIQKGYEILNKISEAIKDKKTSKLSDLSSDFFSYIPTPIGYSNAGSLVIKDEEAVKKKLELLDSLSNIKTTYELIEQKTDAENLIDANYAKLKCNIDVIEKGSNEYTFIEKFINNTKQNRNVSITNVFKIEREGEYDRYTKDIDNKLLLWHGSRLTNFVGILSQGLRIAPPEAPASGYRFGKGIYLADMFSKSHGYCASYGSNGVFCIMLCEGACGNMNELKHDDFYASNLPAGKHSTKALGALAPPINSYLEVEKGIKIPQGEAVKTEHQDTSCSHNEYIIYNVNQVRIRYLIWMKDESSGRLLW